MFCLLASASQVSATIKVINISELQGELTQALRSQINGLSSSDTAYINFDHEGNDTKRGTITVMCNVVMSGLGKCKSNIILDNLLLNITNVGQRTVDDNLYITQ